MSKKPSTQCHCGRPMPKAARTFGGVAYCKNCYKQEFQRRPCIKCGAPARLHRTQDQGLCRACEIEKRKCLRCEAAVPRAALTLPSGVVCKNCRRFYPPFRKPEVRPDFVTCSGCRRHRRPVIWTLVRKPLCIKCVDEGYVEVARIEQENYWIAQGLDRWSRAAAAMPSDWHRDLAIKFGRYLIEEIGPDKGALQVQKQIRHVLELFNHVPGPANPTRDQLLAAYTAGDIRKAELFFRFLRSLGVDVPSREQLTDATERKRTKESLAKVVGNPLRELVLRYHEKLVAKPKATAKSVRLSIFSATSFALSCNGEPTDAALDRYLRRSPGQRNSLYGFVLELTRAGYAIEPPGKRKGKSRSPRSSGLDAILTAARDTESHAELKSLVVAILTSTTGVPLDSVTRLPVGALVQSGTDRVVFSMLEMTATLDDPLASLLGRYLTLRDEAGESSSPHLFPGRPATEPLTAAAVSHHLNKLGIAIERLGNEARRSNKRTAVKKRGDAAA